MPGTDDSSAVGPMTATHHPVRRNLAWLLWAQAATWVVSISLLLVAPRVLGERAFGQLSFVIVYVSFFELVANMGINTFVVKSVARDSQDVRRYLVNAVAFKASFAVVLSGVAITVAYACNLRHLTLLIGAYCIGMILNSIVTTVGAALTGLQQFGGVARWNVLQSYVGGLGGVLVLWTHGSVALYAFVFNLSFIIPIPGLLRKIWPYLHGTERIDLRYWRSLVRGGFPFFILAGLLVVYGTIDVPMLQAMTNSEEVGWYALAYRWVGVPAFIAASVSGAFFPALSAEGLQLGPTFSSLANRALRIVVFIATPAAIGIALISRPFFTLLYGSNFHESVVLLRILALHIPIVSLDIVLGSVVMAADRQRRWVIISIIATVFNPLMNLALIPQSQRWFDNGAIGAAVVTVLTELILMVGAVLLRPPGVLDRPTLGSLGRIVVASGAIAPVVLLLGNYSLGLQIGAGVVTYACASLALRTISLKEIGTMLARVTSRRSSSNRVDEAQLAVQVPARET